MNLQIILIDQINFNNYHKILVKNSSPVYINIIHERVSSQFDFIKIIITNIFTKNNKNSILYWIT